MGNHLVSERGPFVVIAFFSQGKKVLVWCLFIGTIQAVQNELRKQGISATSVYGADNYESRINKINDFKFGSTQVLITNPNTLAESVSLHMCCHDAVYIEYGFNLTYMLQSKDRINRVGLPEGTKTHYYFAIEESPTLGGGSIDSLILERLNMKSERMIETIESHELKPEGYNENIVDDINYILNKGRPKS